MSDSPVQNESPPGPDRRRFISGSSLAMVAGLAGSYGTLGAMAGRYLYLYPAGSYAKAWLFVSDLEGMPKGEAINFVTPTGARVVIARKDENGTADDFVALASICPHLGCQVHWEPQNNRFFCPCHNGVFDPDGAPVSGPPASAGQSLARYPLDVRNGLLFIEVPVEGLRSPKEA